MTLPLDRTAGTHKDTPSASVDSPASHVADHATDTAMAGSAWDGKTVLPRGIPARPDHRQVPLTTPGASADAGIAPLIEWTLVQGIATNFSCQGGPPAEHGTAYIAFPQRSGSARFLATLSTALTEIGSPEAHKLARRLPTRRRLWWLARRSWRFGTRGWSSWSEWMVRYPGPVARSAVYFPHTDLLALTQVLNLAP